LLDSQIDELKITLMRFAKDFTKLAEYFGPDDYEKNINVFENLNNFPSKRLFDVKKEEGFQDEEEKTNKKGKINTYKK